MSSIRFLCPCPAVAVRANQIMDDQWESKVIEYGAINITGFRIVDHSRRVVREFLEGWRRLDPVASKGAGKDSISVRCSSSEFIPTLHVA